MTRNREMTGQELMDCLEALDANLSKRKLSPKPLQIIVVGGFYMIQLVGSPRMTQDIDYVPMNFTVSIEPDPASKVWRAACWAVAKQFQMNRDWINDGPSTLTPIHFHEGNVSLWKKFTSFEVYVPHMDVILAMKLLAGREKDDDDIRRLCELLEIRTRTEAQAILDRYIRLEDQLYFEIENSLSRYFSDQGTTML